MTTKRTRRKGYRSHSRNALYRLAAEYKRRHPKATAADAWLHLIAVAATGAHDVVLRHDERIDAIEYYPDTDSRSTKIVKRRSFEQGFYRIGNIFA